jgi:hypothetical protein
VLVNNVGLFDWNVIEETRQLYFLLRQAPGDEILSV